MSAAERTPAGTGGGKSEGFAGTVAQQHPNAASEGARKEVGTAASSREHPPHVTENDEGKPVQAEHDNAQEVPTLPANATGSDKVTTADHNQPIDEASMYDRRPSQDKDQPPSAR